MRRKSADLLVVILVRPTCGAVIILSGRCDQAIDSDILFAERPTVQKSHLSPAPVLAQQATGFFVSRPSLILDQFPFVLYLIIFGIWHEVVKPYSVFIGVLGARSGP